MLSKFERRVLNGELNPYQKTGYGCGPEAKAAWMEMIGRRGHRYAACTLDSFKPTCAAAEKILKTLQDYASEMPERLRMGESVILTGPAGTGKDHLLMGLMRCAIEPHMYSVDWRDGGWMYQEIKSAIKDNRTYELIDRFCEPQILTLSDPTPDGDELTAYENRILRNIIEKRYSKSLVTWITTNVSSTDESDESFGATVADRLRHNSLVLQCDWQSYRATRRQGAV